jgi:hypothetical protein
MEERLCQYKLYECLVFRIIIISCYPLWVSTKRLHLVLSLAILFTSLQLFPFSNASLWTDLHHVCLGLPLPFSPAGSNPRPLFQWLHSISSVYVLSKSISVSLSVWISRFLLSFSKVLHLKSLPANECS